jgi:hypothetical protein
MRTSEAKREIKVHMKHPIRTSVLGIVAMLNVAVFAPVDVRAQEEILSAAPAIDASWDETSGYGAVEATRAAINALPEEPAVITSLVPSAVRWAPAEAIAPMPSVGANRDATPEYEALSYGPSREVSVGSPSADASRLIAAQRALASDGLGSMQEDALMALVAAATSWDDMSGYGSVEATRAAIPEEGASAITDESERLAQFRAVEIALSHDLQMEDQARSYQIP